MVGRYGGVSLLLLFLLAAAALAVFLFYVLLVLGQLPEPVPEIVALPAGFRIP